MSHLIFARAVMLDFPGFAITATFACVFSE